jgi:hypothetical protein
MAFVLRGNRAAINLPAIAATIIDMRGEAIARAIAENAGMSVEIAFDLYFGTY